MNSRYCTFSIFCSLLASICSLMVAATAFAAEPVDSPEWRGIGNLYLWGAQIDVTTASGAQSDIPFSTIVDNLEMAFMGGLGARNNKWTIAADVIYLEVKGEPSNLIRSPGRLNPTLGGEAEVKSWIVTPTVGYAVHNSEKARVELLAGARYLSLDTGVTLTVNNAPVFSASGSNSIWDGVVGMRAEVNLAPKWYMPLYIDVGTGDSKSTWQGLTGIGYRFGKISAVLAYRYLEYDLDNDLLVDDMTVKGPMGGISFAF